MTKAKLRVTKKTEEIMLINMRRSCEGFRRDARHILRMRMNVYEANTKLNRLKSKSISQDKLVDELVYSMSAQTAPGPYLIPLDATENTVKMAMGTVSSWLVKARAIVAGNASITSLPDEVKEAIARSMADQMMEAGRNMASSIESLNPL